MARKCCLIFEAAFQTKEISNLPDGQSRAGGALRKKTQNPLGLFPMVKVSECLSAGFDFLFCVHSGGALQFPTMDHLMIVAG
jgi:hypothetical protein